MEQRRSGWALLASLFGHAALVTVCGFVTARSLAASPPPAPPVPERDPPGETFDVEALNVSSPGSPAEPAQQEEPAAVPRKAKRSGGRRFSSRPSEAAGERAERTLVREHGRRRDREGIGEKRRPPGDGPGKGGWGAATGAELERQLARSFTRALPAAVSADRRWSELPLGEVGAIELTLELDASGAIASVRYDEQADAALRSVIERTLPLLRHGSFGLTVQPGAAGSETLRIAIALSTVATGESDRPDDVLRLGYEPPSLDAAGKAHFTLGSGRHFEATVTVLRSLASP